MLEDLPEHPADTAGQTQRQCSGLLVEGEEGNVLAVSDTEMAAQGYLCHLQSSRKSAIVSREPCSPMTKNAPFPTLFSS